jgi:hypothetical protein
MGLEPPWSVSDSPVGLAGWIMEKFRTWSDCEGEVERCFSKDELLTNIMIYQIGARGPLPSGTGGNGPVPEGKLYALVPVFTRALNPCLLGVGPVLLAPLHVRGGAAKKPSRRQTCAVILAASKYPGHPTRTPGSTGGHPASSSVRSDGIGLRSPLAFAMGSVTVLTPRLRQHHAGHGRVDRD